MDSRLVNRIPELPDEQQILLWAIRLDDLLTQKAARILYAKQGLNHSRLLDTALRKGLSPLLYQKIKTLDQKRIDPEFRRALKTVYMENTARNMRMVNDLERICSELDRQGLSYIAYKGPVAGMLGYNDTAFRQFSDLDIMIRHQEFDRVLRFFAEMGFGFPTGFKKKVLDYTRKSWRDMGVSKGNLHIDLHQMIAKGPCFFRPFDETWKNCVELKLNRESVWTFSIEDSLVVHAINNAKDGFSSLKEFRDIAGLINNWPDLDWDRVVLGAQRRKCLNILLVSVKLAQLFCGAVLPESIRVLTQRPSVDKKVRFYVDRLFSTGLNVDILSWYLTVPACLDTVLSKIRFYVWFASNPAPQLHPEIFRLPGFLFFLFPVIHPFNLLFRYGRAVFLKAAG
jgi:hypothetical protein